MMALAMWKWRGIMVRMNKFKYWLLVTAAIVKAFTPSIMMFGAHFIFSGTVLGELMFILGIVSLGWITDLKLPEKPE